jgi:hypothetical protein
MEAVIDFFSHPLLTNFLLLVTTLRWFYLERWKSKLNPYFITGTSGKKITMYSTESELT